MGKVTREFMTEGFTVSAKRGRIYRQAPTPELFWRKVKKDGVIVNEDLGHCWEWQGCLNANGYGVFGSAKARGLAHRISWLLEHGALPTLLVCHRCDNRRCVRPSHLFMGTHLDNSVDCHKKGRGKALRGEDRPNAKLNDELVRYIRVALRSGESQRALARRIGIPRGTISVVACGLSWRHVQ